MTRDEWVLFAALALAKGSEAARSAMLAAADDPTKRALEESAEYMEAILDLQPK